MSLFNSVTITAISIPTAEIKFPLRAVLGELSILMPRIKQTEAMI